MFWSVGGAYFARRDCCKTYLGDLRLSESDGLLESDVFVKSVKRESVN